MTNVQRLARVMTTGAVAAMLIIAAGCGNEADSSLDVAEATSAAKGNSAPAPSGSIAVAPNTASLGDAVTVSVYPGAYASARLFVNWVCYQNGAQVSHDGSYELHEAVAKAFPGYAWTGDHYEWTFTFEPLQSYTGGAANCDAWVSYVNRKSVWIKFATTTWYAQ